METLYLAFANQEQDPLPRLLEEDKALNRILAPLARANRFYLEREQYATLTDVGDRLGSIKDSLWLFHYGGHADQDELLLQDTAARSEGIAHWLGQCPRLQLVVLNGCSTAGQVRALLDLGVPVVIATHCPIDDERARDFAIAFYQQLESGATIGDAFEWAIGNALAQSALGVQRGFGAEFEAVPTDRPVWGLFYQSSNESALMAKLPAPRIVEQPADYSPNELLVNTLMETLEGYSDEVALYAMQERKNKKVPLAKKRMAILNSLTAPLAEHLRKLLVPGNRDAESYDQVNQARLRQLVNTYQIALELISFVTLARLWDAKLQDEQLRLPAQYVELVTRFLLLDKEQRAAYDHMPMIRSLQQFFAERQIRFFANDPAPYGGERASDPAAEGGTLDGTDIYKDEEFVAACLFMETLRRNLTQDAVAPYEVTDLCIRGEEKLCSVLSKLGLFARYTMATVKNIDVHKYRSLDAPEFNHRVVKLIDLLGGLEESEMQIEKFLDSRSVLLLNEEDLSYLSLSPFIIDENAFIEKTDISKVYFLHHYDPVRQCYRYRFASKPEDKELEVTEQSFPIVWQQLRHFKQLFEA